MASEAFDPGPEVGELAPANGPGEYAVETQGVDDRAIVESGEQSADRYAGVVRLKHRGKRVEVGIVEVDREAGVNRAT